MSKKNNNTSNQDYNDYLDFVTKRLASHDFQAEKKIKAIDELADIIFTARSNFKKSKNENIS